MPITTQGEFNQAVNRAFYNLYILSIDGAEDHGEDVAFRDELAAIGAYAFPSDAAMPSEPPAVPGDD